MEKNTTDCLKGAAAVVVMLYHLTFYSDNRMLSLIFANTGQLAVAVFLFMSGYGLTVRFQKKGRQYFEGFWLNKVFHLILIFLVSGTVVTVINNIFFHTDYNAADIVRAALRFCYPNGRELWFVAIILYCYVCFWIGRKYLKGSLIWIVLNPIIYIGLCIAADRGTWWYNTAFCFAIGELTALYKKQIDKKTEKGRGIWLLAATAVFLVIEWKYRQGVRQLQYICPVSFLVLIYLFTLRVRVNSRILKFFNQMTFELYLVHLIVYKIFFSVRDPGIRWYIPMYAVILMLAYITMQADKAVFKGARKLADCICDKHRKA